MSTISLNANPVQVRESAQLSPVQDRSWTDVKIKRTWAASAAGIALTGAAACTALAFTASLWLLGAAIPLVLATGALVWYCFATVDYENPEELAKVRAQALKMNLPEIIQKHGLDKLIRYSILTPKQFEKAYSAHAETLDLKRLIAAYEEVSDKLDRLDLQNSGFNVPEPKLWRKKLVQETNGLDFGFFHDNKYLSQLIGYGLIQPKELEDSFAAYANAMPLSEIIGRYEKTVPVLRDGFSLPSPERWKEKFRDETAHLNCSEILSYSLNPDTLLKYNIIAKVEREILSEAQKANGLYYRQEDECRAEFDKRTEREKHICEKTKDLARRSYEAASDEGYGNALFTQYMRDLNALEQSAELKIDAEKVRLTQLRGPATEEEIKQLAASKLRCENACRHIRQRLDFDKAFLHANYERTKTSYRMNLESARQIRDQAYALADEQYTFATKPVRNEVDAKLAKFAEEKKIKLSEINARYESFRHANRQPVSEGLEARAV